MWLLTGSSAPKCSRNGRNTQLYCVTVPRPKFLRCYYYKAGCRLVHSERTLFGEDGIANTTNGKSVQLCCSRILSTGFIDGRSSSNIRKDTKNKTPVSPSVVKCARHCYFLTAPLKFTRTDIVNIEDEPIYKLIQYCTPLRCIIKAAGAKPSFSFHVVPCLAWLPLCLRFVRSVP